MYILLNNDKHQLRNATIPSGMRTSCSFQLEDKIEESQVAGTIGLYSDDDMFLNEFNVDNFLRFELTPNYKYTTSGVDEEGNPISVSEEDGCTLLLTNDPVYIPPEPVLPSEEELLADAKQNKKREVLAAKQQIVVAGIDVETEYGVEHFPLSQENITMLTGISMMIAQGLPSYPFHSYADTDSTNICKTYSAADLQKIVTAALSYVTYHESYANMMLQWIDRETDRTVVEAMVYGCALPDDLAAYMQVLLTNATTQVTPDPSVDNSGTENPDETGTEEQIETPATTE